MQTVWACMPHSENDVFIARLQSSQPTLMDNQQKGAYSHQHTHQLLYEVTNHSYE